MRESLSKINQKKYVIPDPLDDLDNIEKFLANNRNKKIIVVMGLGFVGAVMSIVCANSSEEYAVLGVDLPDESNYWKIKSLNDGIFPLIADDPKIETYYKNAKEKNNFYATYDKRAFSFADIIIIDINLDVDKKSFQNFKLDEFDINLNNFKSAIKTVGLNCKEDVLILVETTVPPGTCSKLIYPILKKEIDKRGLSSKNMKLGHSYERVMPGPDYIDSISAFPRVYSGINKSSADSVESFLKTIIDIEKCELTRLKDTNASEIAKVLENSYRAMNIAFIVEWSRFAEDAGVDLYQVVNAIRVRKTHSNMMFPGIGVGGYCLTKDPLLASWSKKKFFNSSNSLRMSVDSVSTNDQMPYFAYKRLIDVFGPLKNKKIIFLGVSYRGDVGDTRFSPVENLVKLVKKNTSQIAYHDPFVSYWEELDITVDNDLANVLKFNADIIIISSGHKEYTKAETTDKLIDSPPSFIYDTIGLLSNDQKKYLSGIHKLSILGSGDVLKYEKSK